MAQHLMRKPLEDIISVPKIKVANRHHILFHLTDASEQITSLIEEVQKGALSEKDFRISLKHAYHHLNWAWNGRKARKEELEAISDQNFAEWRLFPSDIRIEDGG